MVKKILAFFRRLIVLIFMSPFLIRLRKYSPRLYYFLSNRFSLHKFSGMPFTLLVIAMSSNLIMMLDVYSDILNSKEFVSIDSAVAAFLFSMRVDAVAKFFYLVTQLGNQYVILAGVVGMSILFLVRKKAYMITGILIAVAGSALTVQLGKRVFKIDRPFHYSYYHMSSFSFPSGHATAAMAFYGIVFYLLIRQARKQLVKFILLLTWLLLVIFIGFSRIYLCEHFLSDVVGGYLLGFWWLLLSISTILWEEDRLRRRKK